MAIHASGEDYLETILLLSKEQKDVHSVEVARRMGVAKPTVTKAVKNLIAEDCIAMDGVHLRLTEKGRLRAEEVYQKHLVLTEFWQLFGVPKSVAEGDACRMEHCISPETFSAVCNFVAENKKK